MTAVAVLPEVSDFLEHFRLLPDDKLITNVPGMPGIWKVSDLRTGLNRKAIGVHSNGLGLAVLNADRYSSWCDEMATADRLGPRMKVDPVTREEIARITRRVEMPAKTAAGRISVGAEEF